MLQKAVNENRYDTALKHAVELGSILVDEEAYEKAFKVFQNGKDYAQKIQSQSKIDRDNEFLTHRGAVETLAQYG